MRYVTISNSFEFFRNTKRDHLIAEGRVKSRGTTLCVVEVEIRDETEKLLCGGTFTMLLRRQAGLHFSRVMWYHSFPQAMRERFGGKVYKLALDGGMTCPNRDGTLGTRGLHFL